MNALDAIRKRRSVRQFTGEALPRADLEAIVDAGRCAASGFNRQPWTFVVVTERALIAQLAVAADWLTQAGAVVAVVLDPTAEYWKEDGAAAVQNLLVAATALGYGSCWLEGRTRRHEAALKALLAVPDDRRLVTLVALGVPVAWPTKDKKPLAEVLRWQTYSNE